MKKLMKTEALCMGLAIISVLYATNAKALTLDQYLDTVFKKNKSFSSYQASKTAAENRYEQSNLELSPVLNMSAGYLDDKSLTVTSSGSTTHAQARNYSLGLAKKFSTGTSASVTGSVQAVNAEGTASTGAFNTEIHTGTMAFALSQSLWKDFFGANVRLRLERESAQRQLEIQSYDLQAKQSVIAAETAFWDLFYLQEELELKKSGLERAQRIDAWIRRRVSNGIGDKADSLGAESLVALRNLDLIRSQDQLIAAQKNFADQLELSDGQPLPKLEAVDEQERSLDRMVGGGKSSGRIVRLDAYLSALEAKAKAVGAREADNSLSPDLVLQGQYKTNGYDTTDEKAFNKANTSKDYPVTSVGVTFSWLLDWDTKGSVREAAKQDALAAQLKKERVLLESETSWKEINRRHKELTKMVEIAKKLKDIQTAKALAEKDKLTKGRSITSTVVTAEQDAADAEVNLLKMRSELRKLESQARLFVRIEDNI
jgi:outer membrane protein TolC